MISAKIFAALVFSSYLGHFLFFQQNTCAASSLGEAVDCTKVHVDYSDDPTLTREERLRLMDQAFFESLSRFELCQAAARAAKSAAGAGGNGSGNGSGGGADNGPGQNSADSGSEKSNMSAGGSVASSTMSGTEAEQTSRKIPSADGMESADTASLPGSQAMDEAKSQSAKNSSLANGKLPDDIPSAKNDDALAAQIRYAAENEPDPVKSAQLWNEYRKYKGLASR
ncbi:hypothetical protein [Desulfocastanea catecholica]